MIIIGETECRGCHEIVWHIIAHDTGKCPYCNAEINWCDSCNTPISKGGDKWVKKAVEETERMLGGGNR